MRSAQMFLKNNTMFYYSIILKIVSNHCLLTSCGRIKRVVGGIEVECGTQARVASLRNANSQHLCGATLLSPHFALTSAHCVHLGEEYILLLNNYCFYDEPPRADILEIINNELYDEILRTHDIALLRIKLNLDDSAWLYGAVLPTSSFGISGECTIYGYGFKGPDTIEASVRLLAGKLRIVSLDQCTEALGLFVAPKYDSGMMCALGEGVDACQGDSGSPLVCGGYVEGISSYGMSCAVPGLPGVYTSVGQHLHWIQTVMNGEREMASVQEQVSHSPYFRGLIS